MRRLLSLITLFLIVACNHTSKVEEFLQPPQNSKKIQLTLIDSLGNVTLSIPTRYDTTFSWTHTSDCGKLCDRIKYRFQPKTLPIFKEWGFYWETPKDSIEQLTVYHSGEYPFKYPFDSTLIFRHHKGEKNGILYDSLYKKIRLDTIQKIGDRYFSILGVEVYDKKATTISKILMGATTIKMNVIHFDFELLTSKQDSISTNFIQNSKRLLETIHLSNGR